MANCSDRKCWCVIHGGDGVQIAGNGTVDSPYVISGGGLSGSLRVSDTETVDLVMVGNGTPESPYVLSANVTGGGGGGWYLDGNVLVFPEEGS